LPSKTIQTISGAQKASHSINTGILSQGKAAGALRPFI